MKVLSLSSCFPSHRDPVAGVFVLRRLVAMAKHVDLEVVHPVAWFPGYDRYVLKIDPLIENEVRDGLRVYHPRFFFFPRVLKRWDARFYDLGLRGWLHDYCRTRRPDLLDAHFSWPDGVGVSYLARRMGIPYTITLRGVIIPRYRLRRFRSRLADALCNAAAVISVDKRMAEIAMELGVSASRVHVIPNGVDGDFFDMVPRKQARRQLGLQEDGPLVVSVGHVMPRKAHEDIIEAIARLSPTIRLVVVGRSTDQARVRMLQDLAVARGLSGRVTFAGNQPADVVATYLNAADVSVLASLSEGCPNAVIESLACGTPVVASKVGYVPDLIRPGENGQIVPVKDPAALAEALAWSLGKTWSRESVRQSVVGRPWEKVADEVLSVFKGIVQH